MKHAIYQILLIAVVMMIATSGCASSSLKEYNPKMGLLDRMARMEPARHSSTDSAKVDSEELQEPEFLRTSSATTATASKNVKGVSLQWPLREVRITSAFGKRGREFHEGVDLHAKAGTPVFAAHGGQVLYADSRIHGYGRMIVLKHSSGLATIYAHNSKLVVKKGQWVSQGTLIAYSGNTGHSTGPHLHFEVREGTAAVNPVSVLPKPSSASRASVRGAAVVLAASP